MDEMLLEVTPVLRDPKEKEIIIYQTLTVSPASTVLNGDIV